MASLLIVYHSQSGSSARLARAVWEGARREEGVDASACRAVDVDSAMLAVSSGLVLVAAENAGHLSGGMKECLDRVFYPSIERGLVLPFALLISAGNDGRQAAREAETMLKGIPFKRVMETQIMRGEVDDDMLAQSAEIGQGFAAGLEMGIY